MLNMCDNEHDEICYLDRVSYKQVFCPLCEKIKEIEVLEDKIEALENKIEEKEVS